MRKPGSAAPRGRPFSAGLDPRRARGRPRKVDGNLFEEIAKAAGRGDLRRIGKLLALARDPARTVAILPEDTSPEEQTRVIENLRRLAPTLFEPREIDLVRLYGRDPSAALAVVPHWMARRRLGLLAADDSRGWPELSP